MNKYCSIILTIACIIFCVVVIIISVFFWTSLNELNKKYNFLNRTLHEETTLDYKGKLESVVQVLDVLVNKQNETFALVNSKTIQLNDKIDLNSNILDDKISSNQGISVNYTQFEQTFLILNQSVSEVDDKYAFLLFKISQLEDESYRLRVEARQHYGYSLSLPPATPLCHLYNETIMCPGVNDSLYFPAFIVDPHIGDNDYILIEPMMYSNETTALRPILNMIQSDILLTSSLTLKQDLLDIHEFLNYTTISFIDISENISISYTRLDDIQNSINLINARISALMDLADNSFSKQIFIVGSTYSVPPFPLSLSNVYFLNSSDSPYLSIDYESNYKISISNTSNHLYVTQASILMKFKIQNNNYDKNYVINSIPPITFPIVSPIASPDSYITSYTGLKGFTTGYLSENLVSDLKGSFIDDTTNSTRDFLNNPAVFSYEIIPPSLYDPISLKIGYPGVSLGGDPLYFKYLQTQNVFVYRLEFSFFS